MANVDISKYSQSSDASKDLKLISFIDLSGSSGRVDIERVKETPNNFTIITPKAEHILHAHTSEAALDWVDAIEATVMELQQHNQSMRRGGGGGKGGSKS